MKDSSMLDLLDPQPTRDVIKCHLKLIDKPFEEKSRVDRRTLKMLVKINNRMWRFEKPVICYQEIYHDEVGASLEVEILTDGCKFMVQQIKEETLSKRSRRRSKMKEGNEYIVINPLGIASIFTEVPNEYVVINP